MIVRPLTEKDSPEARLEWILDFVQNDLNLTPQNPLEVMKFVQSYSTYVRGDHLLPDEMKPLLESLLKDGKEMESSEWDKLRYIHSSLRKLVLEQVLPQLEKGGTERITLPFKVSVTIDPSRREPISVDVEEDYAAWIFVNLLGYVGFGAIRKCEHCKHYFVNSRAAKKRFCSPSCNWKFNSQRRRESGKKIMADRDKLRAVAEEEE